MSLKLICLVLALAAVSTSAVAQVATTAVEPAEKTTPVITLKVDGLTCTTPVGTGTFRALSWTFGASQPATSTATGGSTSVGKVNIQNLSIVKDFDECSPKLFAAVTSGQKLTTVTLTQTDAGGKTILMTVKLQTVGITQFQLGGSPTSDHPGEQISFSFARITVTNNQNNVSAGWDITSNKTI